MCMCKSLHILVCARSTRFSHRWWKSSRQRVKVSSDSQCSRTLPMNVAIKSAHCGCERNSCKDWAWLKMCGKHGRIWSKTKHCIKVWYSDSQTCLGQRVHSRPLSSLVPQCLDSHCNVCELSLMEAMVRLADNGMGSNMYWCVRFPRFAKNMVL